VILKVKVCGIG